ASSSPCPNAARPAHCAAPAGGESGLRDRCRGTWGTRAVIVREAQPSRSRGREFVIGRTLACSQKKHEVRHDCPEGTYRPITFPISRQGSSSPQNVADSNKG